MPSSLSRSSTFTQSSRSNRMWSWCADKSRPCSFISHQVEEIRMRGRNEIRYLWESEAEEGKVLVNLRKLDVAYCSNLVSLGEKEEDDCGSNLTSLRTLRVFSCKSLEHCICPDSIESLSIDCCDSITSVSFPTDSKSSGSMKEDFLITMEILSSHGVCGDRTGTPATATMRSI
ncbi:hypothetical protein L2E82_45239 [Cichorium intybus]|uniref:Uncharacterized protein n=1 Tax=Cichorium intybus TaxID=13427 RepID=A0ACB8ZSJ9_CICIN|nr:hypothetical protein L2E82_45239 [Cichorium intybus]